MEMTPSRQTNAVATAEERRMAEDELGGHHPFFQEMLRAVEIGEEGVEDPQALADPRFDSPPIVRRDDQRDRIEDPRTLPPLGILVDVVGDAVVADQPPRLLPALGQLRLIPLPENRCQPPPVGAGLARQGELVV